jgi:Ca2+-binding RTX toxin-like protein
MAGVDSIIEQCFEILEKDNHMSLLSSLFPNIITGTSKADILKGTSRIDIISGLGGDDKIYGHGGNDLLLGWDGNDRLYGGSGSDALWGGYGNDDLYGGSGNDRLYGGYGNDNVYGGTGNDVLFGGAGSDRFYFNPNQAGEGKDRIADFNPNLDKIVLNVSDVLASTPGLLEQSGDPNALEATDLDNSTLWNLSASKDGDLVISHPNGSIEIDTIDFSPALTFADVLPLMDLVAPPETMTI